MLRSESAGSEVLVDRDSWCVHSTTEVISEIGKRITEAMAESGGILWLEQKLG